ncbi:hypothetical protein BH747_02175 [Enterococcus villorum]|uniref:Integrase n=1 Tax=Enterococcus villorum TaxID=112904 RepID=A0A1V8YGH5_9ENTE|nr:hypothetical protein BH747_02175 [Enterococcus villorum]OQO71801.1 hypothetical protein BH744_13405 [Enterococcus villorum]
MPEDTFDGTNMKKIVLKKENPSIMDRVGHSDMKTTLEIYNQVTSATKEKVIQEVDSWIF